MYKFNITIDQHNIASQIANLLNYGHQLIYNISPPKILASNISYIIELEGDIIIGVIGVEKKTTRVSEIKHLCVHPNKRRCGLGLKLLKCALNSIDTDIVYGNVAIDNIASIKNNLKIKMLPTCKHISRNKTIITFSRRISSAH